MTAPTGTLKQTVRAEIRALRASGELGEGQLRPRCYVCCEAESRDFVNKLLAAGLTNREIAEACEYINARREKDGDDRLIKTRNVWVHRTQHFNVDKPVQAAHRAILERRAKEAGKDYEEGVGTAVTAYAVHEVAMAKGYAHLTDDETTVTVTEALKAARDFHEMTSKDSSNRKMSDVLYELDRIITVIQRVVPPQYHDAILAGIRGKELPGTAVHEIVEEVHEVGRKAVREFTPTQKIADEDEI